MAMLSIILAFHGTSKFASIGLGQEYEIKEITLRPEIWWHDAVFHETDQCVKLPHAANVFIFWSRPAEDAVVLWTSCHNLYGAAGVGRVGAVVVPCFFVSVFIVYYMYIYIHMYIYIFLQLRAIVSVLHRLEMNKDFLSYLFLS